MNMIVAVLFQLIRFIVYGREHAKGVRFLSFYGLYCFGVTDPRC